jgi:hypothetical protein
MPSLDLLPEEKMGKTYRKQKWFDKFESDDGFSRKKEKYKDRRKKKLRKIVDRNDALPSDSNPYNHKYT